MKISDSELTENEKLLPSQTNVRSDEAIASIKTHSEPIDMLPVPSTSQIKKLILASTDEDHDSSPDLPEKLPTIVISHPGENSSLFNGK